MKKEIDVQSKNEVKEMLDEYIVAPISKNIESMNAETGNNIEGVKEQIENGIIPNLSRGNELLNGFKNDFEDINEKIGECSAGLEKLLDYINDIKNIQEDEIKKISGLNDASKNLNDKTDLLEKNIENTRGDLSKWASDYTEMMTESQRQLSESGNKISNSVIMAQKELSKENSDALEKIQELIKYNDELLEYLKISQNKTDEINRKVLDNIHDLNVGLNDFKTNVNNKIDYLKKMFILVMITCFANTVGLIAIIILFATKF